VTRIGRQQLRAGLLAIGLLWAPGAAAAACTGDCDGNGAVTVAELITGVRISLGEIALSECEAFDANRDGQLRIDELVAAVNNALGACPPTPMATPTETAAAPTATATDIGSPTAPPTPVATDTPTAPPTPPPVAGVWTEEPLTVTDSTCPTILTETFAGDLASRPPCEFTVELMSETAVVVEDCAANRVDGTLAGDGTIAITYPTTTGAAGPCTVDLTPSAVIPAGVSPTTAVYVFAVAFSGDDCPLEDCTINAEGTWTKQ
jgi:hypothetical protein